MLLVHIKTVTQQGRIAAIHYPEQLSGTQPVILYHQVMRTTEEQDDMKMVSK